jgi:hypothetical protein
MKELDLPLEDDRAIEELTKAAPDVLGSVLGASLGLLLGGPPGALVGAATGPAMSHTLRRVGTEVSRRLLGPREASHVGAVYLLTAAETKRRLDDGEEVRTDDFFDTPGGRRSTAEEVTEAVFLAAQREYEERKLPYIATLLSNIAFHPEIDRAQAVALLRMAQSLSYRQLCLMAFYRYVEVTGLPRLVSAAPETQGVALLISELSDLASRGLVLPTATYDGGESFFGPDSIDRLTRTAEHLYVLMGLDKIPEEDFREILIAIHTPD